MSLRPFERAFLLGVSSKTEWKRRTKEVDYTPIRKNYSVTEHEIVMKNLHLTDLEIGLLIGRTAISVKRYRQSRGIIKGKDRGYMNYKNNFKQYQTI
jgi:hypothetical protein